MAATKDEARITGGTAAVVTLVFCFLTACIEGIDLQSMGIAAPSLKPEFGLDNGQLGWILAASPIGLFFGSFFGGRLADAFGRKSALVGSMLVFGVFQLTTVWAPNYEILGAIRLLCGLGLGGALPNLIALTSEAASGKSRIVSVVITAAGMPVGGGLASAIMFLGGDHASWRTVFYIGGIAPLVLGPLMAFALPESRMFKAAKAAEAAGGKKLNTFTALFGEGRAISSLLIWIAMLFTTIVTYLLLNWLPVLMVAKGFTKPEASFIQIWFNVGAAVGLDRARLADGAAHGRQAGDPRSSGTDGAVPLLCRPGGLACGTYGDHQQSDVGLHRRDGDGRLPAGRAIHRLCPDAVLLPHHQPGDGNRRGGGVRTSGLGGRAHAGGDAAGRGPEHKLKCCRRCIRWWALAPSRRSC